MQKIIALIGCSMLLASPALAAVTLPAPLAGAAATLPAPLAGAAMGGAIAKDGAIFESPIVLYDGPTEPLPSNINVPEPATWAMLITGFGLVGLVVRRRRTAIHPYAG